MKLFDYIKVLFGKDEDWDKLTDYDKIKNSFMCNRFMAIKFPIQAQMFNALKTSPIGAADCWRIISSKFKRVPGFIYTKIKKAPKTKEWVPNPDAVKLYLKYNEIGEREFSEALKFNKAEVKKAIDILEKQLGKDDYK